MTYLSVKEVADQLGIDFKTVYRLIHKGELAAAKIGGVYRLRQSDLDTFIEQQFVRTREELLQKQVESETVTLLRCERCLRLIKSETQIGGLCQQPECEGPLCTICWAEEHCFCRHHEPTPEQKLAAARQAKAEGKIKVLVTAVEARRRELNFRDRFERKVQGLASVTHPLSGQVIPVKEWTALHSKTDAAHQLADLLNDMPPAWLPLNLVSRYWIPVGKGERPLLLVGHILSHLSAHATQEFDTLPFTAVELLGLLLTYTQQTESDGQVIVVGFAATTGWSDDAVQLLQGNQRGEAWAHSLVFPCLIDLETRAIHASHADQAIEPFLPLYILPLPEEEVTAVEAYTRAILKQQSSLAAAEVVAALNVTTGAVLTAFQRLVATGHYLIEDIDDIGRVIASL